MYPIHDTDALLLLATTLAAKRRPATLVEIVSAGELITGTLPAAPKFAESFASLSRNGLLAAQGDGFVLTAAAEQLMAGQPKKGSSDQRLFHLREDLSAFAVRGEHPAVAVTSAALERALVEHNASAAGTGKNLLVPKPAAPESKAARPGQRQRKPLPARKRKN
jgi:hypothetical protein